jgi:hypothetical protein
MVSRQVKRAQQRRRVKQVLTAIKAEARRLKRKRS